MPYQLPGICRQSGVDAEEFRRRIHQLLTTGAQRHHRLWLYYRNPMQPRAVDHDEQGSDRPYRQAQEWGLPSRITGVRAAGEAFGGLSVEGVARKEVVVENDIAWRIDAMIDFLFGKPIVIESLCTDPRRRRQIESLLHQIIEHNGGMLLFQQLALLGAVHGFVDVLVKFDASVLVEPAPDGLAPSPGNRRDPCAGGSRPFAAESASQAGMSDLDQVGRVAPSPQLKPSADPGASLQDSQDAPHPRIARSIRLEVVEPARALPLLAEDDWRKVVAYAQVFRIGRRKDSRREDSSAARLVHRLGRFAARLLNPSAQDQLTIVEIITDHTWQRYEDENLLAEGVNSLGEIPLVHIQNLALPYQYSGASDVEPLIPLQDELNVRLSDRANRITLQSFKMYLGKGIEDFTKLPVAPGRMWVTDNDKADVIEFGGDPDCPSEDQHITELREALDKASGVTPIAAGAVRGRIGHLTSAAALRVTMMALLAKTQRKRTTYGQAIGRMCRLALAWLDRAGLFATSPAEREVEIRWPELLSDF